MEGAAGLMSMGRCLTGSSRSWIGFTGVVSSVIFTLGASKVISFFAWTMELGPHSLVIGTMQGALVLQPENIVHIEAEGGYARILCDDGKRHLVSWNIGRLQRELPVTSFFRCHDSHIVNLRKVARIHSHDGHQAEMIAGLTVRISRRRYKDFIAALRGGGGGG